MATLVLLVLAPASMGAGLAHATVSGAPYHGVLTGTSGSWSVAGCGHAKIAVKPFFDAHSGIGGFWDQAAAPSCHNPMGSSGSASSAFASQVPVRVHHSNSTVVALLNVTISGNARLTPGVCSSSMATYYYCYQAAYASVSGYAYLLDKTTGAFFYPSNYWLGLYASVFNDVACSAGNCSTYSSGSSGPFHMSATFGWWINTGWVNTADHFVLGITFYGSASAYTSVYGATMTGGSTWAGINAATMGNGIDLASITIT